MLLEVGELKKIAGIISAILAMVIFVWWLVNLNSLLFVGSFLFVTDKNKMNWIGLTGIIAIAGLIYNLYDGRRRFRGDIRSKSRIDWMKTVRNLVAQYLSDCDNIIDHMEHKGSKNFLLGDIGGIGTRFKRNYNEILLYVPDNDSNKLLLDNIKEIYECLKSRDIKTTEKTPKIRQLLQKTVKDSSEYLKIEWENAKRGD